MTSLIILTSTLSVLCVFLVYQIVKVTKRYEYYKYKSNRKIAHRFTDVLREVDKAINEQLSDRKVYCSRCDWHNDNYAANGRCQHPENLYEEDNYKRIYIYARALPCDLNHDNKCLQYTPKIVNKKFLTSK